MANLKAVSFTILVTVATLIGACGGGEPGGGGYPTKTLSWSPPTTYQDGSTLDPSDDLDRFEIYVKENGSFSDTDSEMAALSATDRGTGQVVSSFNLANLAPFLSEGVTYHVSIRAVATNGLKSDFSPSATFSF